MVNIVSKRIKGKEYIYLVESIRKGSKVIQKTIKYIGPKRPVREEEFESMVISHSGKDWILNDFKDELSYQDHQAMRQASIKQKESLRTLDILSKEKEKERFLSEFIANSNAIEGSTLTVKDTYNYLFQDVTPAGSTKKELFMATNLLEAWNYLEKNSDRAPSENDLLELHGLVNKGIEAEETLGKYKKVQNYVGETLTTSYLFVNEKMLKLLKWIRAASRKMNEFEVAFQSHAQFEIIHPFVDGNGRVGRLLLNWLLSNNKLEPLAVRVKNRAEYISALENSRKGKKEAICKFCMQQYLKQYSFKEPEGFGILKGKKLKKFKREKNLLDREIRRE
jgi:Fic family protein